MLLRRGANVDIQTDCGKTALHIAVIQKLADFLVPLKHFNADANLQVLLMIYTIVLLIFQTILTCSLII